MGATEYGVRFRKLPRAVGGGVASTVIHPGQLVFIWPWDSIYKVDTGVRGLSWGRAHNSSSGETGNPDFVHTRALDGNEVALSVTIRYRVKSDPEGLIRMVQEVATNDEQVEGVVTAVARADIRTYMNELRTSDFLDTGERYRAVDRVKESIVSRLDRYNVEVSAVILDDFRFERVLPDASIDSSYQDRLNDTQRMREQTEREKARIDTVVAKKGQEYNEVLGTVNREIAEAEGYKKQATLRGDAYLQTRANESKGLRAQGKAQVQGLIEQINALAGPGGRALLKLDLAKNLLKNDPKFIVMGQGKGNSLDVQRIDANELINQAGLFEAMQPKGGSSREKQLSKTQ